MILSYEDAERIAQRMCQDSNQTDEQVYEDLIALVHDQGASPMVRVDAAEMVYVLAAGPEDWSQHD